MTAIGEPGIAWSLWLRLVDALRVLPFRLRRSRPRFLTSLLPREAFKPTVPSRSKPHLRQTSSLKAKPGLYECGKPLW